jgi:hypothetical protein
MMVNVTTGGGFNSRNISDKEKIKELIELCSIIESENIKLRKEIQNLKNEINILKNDKK